VPIGCRAPSPSQSKRKRPSTCITRTLFTCGSGT
jgi:hypothetical protein